MHVFPECISGTLRRPSFRRARADIYQSELRSERIRGAATIPARVPEFAGRSGRYALLGQPDIEYYFLVFRVCLHIPDLSFVENRSACRTYFDAVLRVCVGLCQHGRPALALPARLRICVDSHMGDAGIDL